MPATRALNRSIGVIGCGHWGPNHLRVLDRIPNVRVTWAADLNEARLQHLATRHAGLQVTTDYRRVLDDRSLDAVIVATPAATHATIATDALHAGKHVLCEKPLGISSNECRDLVDAATRAGLVLMVGHVFLFNPGILEIKELLNGGGLGRIAYAMADRANLGPVRTDVDVAWDLAAHEISIFNFLFDSTPLSVAAEGRRFGASPLADLALLTLTYPGDVAVSVRASWLHPRKVRTLQVVGESGMATFDDLAPRLVTVDAVGSRDRLEPYYDSYGEFTLLARATETRQPAVRAVEPLSEQDRFFVRALDSGDAGRADGRHGWDVVRTLEAAALSMRSGGQTVTLLQPGIAVPAA